MRGYRGKRRNRGTWMPVIGHNVVEGDSNYSYVDQRVDVFPVPSDNAEGPALSIVPIIPDFTQAASEGATANNLRDIVQGQAWRLNRIVGKVQLQTYQQSAGTTGRTWPNVFLTVAFFVAKVDDDAQNSPAMSALDSDPTHKDNVMNPWIWRRTWLLGQPVGSRGDSGDSNFQKMEQKSTTQYNSVADGPHIDSKSKRFINREHRLFMSVAVRGYDVNWLSVDGDQEIGVAGIVDLRIHGQLARQRNTSSF